MEDKIRISGIIFEHGKDDYGLWEGFNLTEDEENQIMEILMNHDTEGCSIRGTQKEIAEKLKRRNHTTVIHAVNKINNEMTVDKELENTIEVIKKKLNP